MGTIPCHEGVPARRGTSISSLPTEHAAEDETEVVLEKEEAGSASDTIIITTKTATRVR